MKLKSVRNQVWRQVRAQVYDPRLDHRLEP